MNETSGLDHKAPEGFVDYEDSLKAALTEEMTSLKKKTDLVEDAPVPSILQKEKQKDREIELARLASADKGSDKGILGTRAKAKFGPRSKSPIVPRFSGSRAELESKIVAQGKLYAAAAMKVVPTSSKCDDLGRAVMSARQANDSRQAVKLACHEPDRIVKIHFDREGRGQAYTQTGATYDQVVARLADAGISPIFPIRDEWLPEGGVAWLIIDGDPVRDNLNDKYPVHPFLYDSWSPENQTFWKQASFELNRALRHPPHKPPKFREQENGWASTLDCLRYLRVVVSSFRGISYETIDNICSYNWLFGVTLCDEKHRFQLAGARDAYGIVKDGTKVISFEFIRVKSGHSGYVAELVNDDSAYLWIDPRLARSISCLCHKTQRQLIRDIFYRGLMPGEMIHAGGRKHVNLSPFLPHDTRNVAVGRQHDIYDTVIIFKTGY